MQNCILLGELGRKNKNKNKKDPAQLLARSKERKKPGFRGLPQGLTPIDLRPPNEPHSPVVPRPQEPQVGSLYTCAWATQDLTEELSPAPTCADSMSTAISLSSEVSSLGCSGFLPVEFTQRSFTSACHTQKSSFETLGKLVPVDLDVPAVK